MLRLAAIPLLFIIACLLSGTYGAVHNQISYTVSPEYFTEFKFPQFNIEPVLPDRVAAAIVGWEASWWMGIVIGFFLIPFGLLIRGTSAYFFGMLKVFGVVLLTAMGFGLVALAVSFVVVSPDNVGELTIRGRTIADPVAFLRAGTMHNFSYIGGLVGIITGGLSILRLFLRAEARDS